MSHGSLASACVGFENPCDVYRLLEEAYIRRGLGEVAIKVKIGQEETTLSLPSVERLKIMRDEYASKCSSATGIVIPTGRKKMCMVFGDHVCGSCAGKGCSSCC